MDPMRPFVVRQGDYLDKLAAQHGFDADAVWNHEKNKPLRDRGRLPNILHPTDVLYIPEAKPRWLPVKIGATNTFTVSARRVTLSLCFKTHGGQPLAKAACVYKGLLESAGPPPKATDDDGKLELTVSTRQGTFAVGFPGEGYRFLVQVGHMDPIGEPSGLAKRLENLGYGMSPMVALGVAFGHWGRAEGLAHHERRTAGFQRTSGLPASGEWDESTTRALERAHGS